MKDDAARLVVRQGPYPDQVYLLSQAITVIGRGPNNDIVLPDAEVSRQHAQIVVDPDGGYMLQDLGSTNGCFINDRRVVGRALLHDGDMVALGDAILLSFYLPPSQTAADEDETPTAEVDVSAAPPVAPIIPLPGPAYTGPVNVAPPVAPPPAATAPAPAAARRALLIGCGLLLLLTFLCAASLYALDAYDNGRLLYCGWLRPFWELLLGPLGFAPLCP